MLVSHESDVIQKYTNIVWCKTLIGNFDQLSCP